VTHCTSFSVVAQFEFSRLDKLVANRPASQQGEVLNASLFCSIMPMVLNSLSRDAESCSNFFGAQTVAEEFHNVPFSWAENFGDGKPPC
jgi:hypothetical protein